MLLRVAPDEVWRPNNDTLFLARVLIGEEVIWTLAAAVHTQRKTRAFSSAMPRRTRPSRAALWAPSTMPRG
jgi:hypothetical protein